MKLTIASFGKEKKRLDRAIEKARAWHKKRSHLRRARAELVHQWIDERYGGNYFKYYYRTYAKNHYRGSNPFLAVVKKSSFVGKPVKIPIYETKN